MVHTKTNLKKKVSLHPKSFLSYVETESENINSSDCKNLTLFNQASLKKQLKSLFKMKKVSFRKKCITFFVLLWVYQVYLQLLILIITFNAICLKIISLHLKKQIKK